MRTKFAKQPSTRTLRRYNRKTKTPNNNKIHTDNLWAQISRKSNNEPITLHSLLAIKKHNYNTPKIAKQPRTRSTKRETQRDTLTKHNDCRFDTTVLNGPRGPLGTQLNYIILHNYIDLSSIHQQFTVSSAPWANACSFVLGTLQFTLFAIMEHFISA